MENKNQDIDFVIIWVDGNDPEWQKERQLYKGGNTVDNRTIRYRDWDNLQYWFRGVEKFCPWVRKIHFVTNGQVPDWLNTKHPKLHMVKHSDYIDEKYLPTFSSHVIELQLHKIEGLSEQFVYFNDDMFLISAAQPEDFFKDGLPCDSAILNPIISFRMDGFASILVNNVSAINTYFEKNKCIKENLGKWFNIKYGTELIRTICLMPWNHFPGFYQSHLPSSFLKSTFETVWEKLEEPLEKTMQHRFRDVRQDHNQWIFKDWQLASGNFVPRSPKIGKTFMIGTEDDAIEEAFAKRNYKLLCLNDDEDITDFEKEKEKIIQLFEQILPDKSEFEK